MTPDNERIISAGGAFLSVLIIILLTPVLWRQRRDLDRRLLALWMICWCIWCGFANLDGVYIMLARLSGIPNLAWLIVNSALLLGAYALLILMSKTLDIPGSRLVWMFGITCLYLVVMIGLFFGSGVAFSSVRLVRETVFSTGELLYYDLPYLYTIIIVSLPLALFVKRFVLNPSREQRMRSGILFVVYSSIILYGVLRVFSSVTIYYALITNPAQLHAMETGLTATFSITQFLWPLAFIPSQWFDFVRQNRRLYHMRRLYRLVQRDCRQSASMPLPGVWRQMWQASFYIDVIAIFMLDIKWLMTQKRLRLKDDRLSDVIRSIDGTLPHQDFIDHCVNQSKALGVLDI